MDQKFRIWKLRTILGRVTSALPGDWERMYSHPVYFAETFIDPDRFRGTCYRAAKLGADGQDDGPRQGIQQLHPEPLH